MVTRTPRLPSSNGNGVAGDQNGANVTVGAAYRLLPEAARSVGGIDGDRRDIDVMLRGGDAAANDLGWYFWSRIPDFRYITRYVANSCSMARLFIGTTGDDPQNPIPVGKRHPANQLLSNFGGGVLGQAQIIDRLATFLTVVGDSILAGPREGAPVPKFPFDAWKVYSTTELVSRNGTLMYRTPGGRSEPLPPGVEPIRVWRPHPRLWWEADSPARSCYSVLREIDLLDQHVHATAVSRLAGAGLLGIPEELTIPGDEAETEGIEFDPFVKMLTEIMSLAIKNRESAAAIVPIVLRGPGEFIAQIKHFDFATVFDEKVPELRNIALRRLALGMDVPPEIMTGTGGASHWCVDDQTEILTHRGWVSESSVLVGDEALSMNHETGLSEWQPIVDIYRADVVDEPMLSIEGAWHSSLTTLGHRWPVRWVRGQSKFWSREWTTSQEILRRGQAAAADSQVPLKLQRSARLAGLPAMAKYEDALVELVAWMFTEGGLTYRDGADAPHKVAIYQSHAVNAGNCSRIRDALTVLYGPATAEVKVGKLDAARRGQAWWREVQEGRRTRFVLSKAAAAPIVEHCPRRVVSTAFIDSLTYSQLRLFIEVAALGDGVIKQTGHIVVGQKDPAMLDALERAAILAGLGVMRQQTVHDGFYRHLQHYVYITPNRLEYRPRSKNITEERYTGRVWCPTVSSTHTVFMRRNGKTCYTGQSAWQIDESSLRVHIIPLLQPHRRRPHGRLASPRPPADPPHSGPEGRDPEPLRLVRHLQPRHSPQRLRRRRSPLRSVRDQRRCASAPHRSQHRRRSDQRRTGRPGTAQDRPGQQSRPVRLRHRCPPGTGLSLP